MNWTILSISLGLSWLLARKFFQISAVVDDNARPAIEIYIFMLLFCNLALLITSASVVLSFDGSTIVPSATGFANASKVWLTCA